MSLGSEERKALVELYLEKSESELADATKAKDACMWSVVANRLYYSLFHAVSALLVKDGHTVGTHLGIKINFGKYYVKTGILTADDGRLFSQMATLRERADYDCFFKVTQKDIDEKFEGVSTLISHIRNILKDFQS